MNNFVVLIIVPNIITIYKEIDLGTHTFIGNNEEYDNLIEEISTEIDKRNKDYENSIKETKKRILVNKIAKL